MVEKTSKFTRKGGEKTETTGFRRLDDFIQTSEYFPTSKLYFHTLNRRLFTDEPDVCFSVKIHYIHAGRETDVWARQNQASVPIAN